MFPHLKRQKLIIDYGVEGQKPNVREFDHMFYNVVFKRLVWDTWSHLSQGRMDYRDDIAKRTIIQKGM